MGELLQEQMATQVHTISEVRSLMSKILIANFFDIFMLCSGGGGDCDGSFCPGASGGSDGGNGERVPGPESGEGGMGSGLDVTTIPLRDMKLRLPVFCIYLQKKLATVILSSRLCITTPKLYYKTVVAATT